MTILATGARGTVGARMLDGLVCAGADVRASARDAATLSPPPGVPAVALDLADPTGAAAALRGIRQVFLYAQPPGIERLLAAAPGAAGTR